MKTEPLDPCPVCGGEMEHDPNHDILVCVVCIYSAPPSNHRRLCAEVALARVVMEHQEAIDAADLDGLAFPIEPPLGHLIHDLRAAIARVREASK